MIANVARILGLILLILLSTVVILWVVVYINGNFIPDQLRWENGKRRADLSAWKTVTWMISFLEWLGMLWLSCKVNGWYSKEWPEVSRKQITTVAISLAAGLTGATFLIINLL